MGKPRERRCKAIDRDLGCFKALASYPMASKKGTVSREVMVLIKGDGPEEGKGLAIFKTMNVGMEG
jgi:hypothetical protein